MGDPIFHVGEGNYPTFKSVIKLLVFINLLLPVILYVNQRNNGNYWYLRHKPDSPSLFDLLAPYPWYIFTLEGLLLLFSFFGMANLKTKRACQRLIEIIKLTFYSPISLTEDGHTYKKDSLAN